jgi:hypothetical protein
VIFIYLDRLQRWRPFHRQRREAVPAAAAE